MDAVVDVHRELTHVVSGENGDGDKDFNGSIGGEL